MWGCMRYLIQVSVLPAADDCQLSPCMEKQHAAPTGKQRIVLLNATNSRHILATLRKAHRKNIIRYVCSSDLKCTLYFEKCWCFTFPTDSPFLWHYYFLNHAASIFLQLLLVPAVPQVLIQPHIRLSLYKQCVTVITPSMANSISHVTNFNKLAAHRTEQNFQTAIWHGTFQLLLQ